MKGNLLGTLLAIFIYIATSSPKAGTPTPTGLYIGDGLEIHGYYVEDSRSEYSS